jgi:hypothetical protein
VNKGARSPTERRRNLDRELGLGSCASAVSAVRVAGELDGFCSRQLQDLLELAADVQEDLSSLLHRSALSSGNIAIATVGDALADRASPDTDTVEALAGVDHDAHDLAVALLLKRLADGGEHDVKPELVDGDGALLLE